MTILAPKKSGQAAKQAEQEAAEQSPPHQQLQQPRSPQLQGNDLLGAGSHRWSPGLREEAEAAVDGSRKRSMRASPHRRTKRERGAASPGSGGRASPDEPPSQQQETDSATADPSGYNSGDEHTHDPNEEAKWQEMERSFAKKISKKGLVVREMAKDGACLFRAVADQVYGDQEMHEMVRKHCMDYLERNRDHFSQYVTEDFDLYVGRKREASCHGNHIELQAVSEMFNRPVQVFCYDSEPLEIWHGCSEPSDDPIILSYERGSHYNSLFDKVKGPPTIRKPQLPSVHQGIKDAALVADALAHSENFAIEQAMLQDKIFASDMEATERALEEQVARASYMDWVREAEKRQKNKMGSSSATATVTSGSSRSRCGSGSPPAGPSSSFDLFYSTPSTSWAPAPGPSSAENSMPMPCSSTDAAPAAQDQCWPAKKKKKQKSDLN